MTDRRDDAEPESGVVNTWPSGTKAAQQLGVTTKRLQQLSLQGSIQRLRAKDGTWRYNPDHLSEVATDDDATAQPIGAEPLRAGGELVKQAQTHAERLLTMVTEPTLRVVSLLSEENERLRRRCAELEQARLDGLAAFEKMLTEAHERELAAQALAANERRKQQAFGMLMQNVPRLLNQIAAAKDPETQARVEATISLLTKMDPIRMTALAESGFLSDSELADVRKIVDPKAALAEAAAAAEPGAASSGFELVTDVVKAATNGASNGAVAHAS